MREQGLRLGVAVVAVAGLAVGVLGGAWWSYESGGMVSALFGSVGLRGLEHCALGVCQSLPFDDQLKGGEQFRAAAGVTYYLALATAAALAIGAVLRELDRGAAVIRFAGYACAVVVFTSIVTVATFPGDSRLLDFTLDWGFFVTVAGGVAGLVTSRLEAGTWRDAVPDRPPSIAGPAAPRAGAEPVAPVAAASASVRDYDYQRAIRDATAVPRVGRNPKQLKKLHRSAARVADAPADAARGTLRFVARSVTLDDDGLQVTYEDGSARMVTWTEIDEVAARRLPPDPPFDKLLVVDLVAGGRPIRLLPSTQVNYDALPGGAAPTSRDNLRALGAEVERRHPGVLDGDSEGFFRGCALPPIFQAMRQFAAYDARFS